MRSVIVNENGGRRKVTKRQAIITQLVNRSATADFRAIKIFSRLCGTSPVGGASCAAAMINPEREPLCGIVEADETRRSSRFAPKDDPIGRFRRGPQRGLVRCWSPARSKSTRQAAAPG